MNSSCLNIRAYKNARLAIEDFGEFESMPKLILLDINMPGMNGFEFLEEFQKLAPELRSRTIIYMLTSSDDVGDKKKALSYTSVKKFITKPLSLEDCVRSDAINSYEY